MGNGWMCWLMIGSPPAATSWFLPNPSGRTSSGAPFWKKPTQSKGTILGCQINLMGFDSDMITAWKHRPVTIVVQLSISRSVFLVDSTCKHIRPHVSTHWQERLTFLSGCTGPTRHWKEETLWRPWRISQEEWLSSLSFPSHQRSFTASWGRPWNEAR